MGSTPDEATSFIGQSGGEISLARTATDGDDEFAFVFRAFGDLEGDMHIGAGGNAHEHALFLADAASHGKGLLVGDRDDFVDDIEVEVVGDKAGTGSLNFVGARFHGLASASLGDDGRIFGFDRDGAEGFFAGFDDFGNTGDGSTRTHGGDKDIDQAIGVGPDFFSGGFFVNGGVGGVFKLLGDKRAGQVFGECFGPGDGAFHSFGGGGEFEFCAQQGKESAALEAHALGHGEDELVAFGGGDESEGDAGVAGGGLDDGGLGRDFALFFRGLYHGGADTVFDTAEGIKEFAFEGDGGGETSGDALKFYEGGLTYRSENIFMNRHKGGG